MRLCLWLFCLLMPALAAGADTIRLIYFAIPPLAKESDGVASGPAVDLVRELTDGLPVSQEPLKMPVKRLEYTLETEKAVVIGLGRSKHRETMGLTWVVELFRDHYHFVTLRGKTPIRTPEEARTVERIACNLGSTPAEMLQDLGITNVEFGTDILSEAAKLHAGHVDAWFDLGSFIQGAWRDLGYDPDDLVWSAPVAGPSLWIAASPTVPPDVIETMRRRYAALQQQGKLDPLFARLVQ